MCVKGWGFIYLTNFIFISIDGYGKGVDEKTCDEHSSAPHVTHMLFRPNSRRRGVAEGGGAACYDGCVISFLLLENQFKISKVEKTILGMQIKRVTCTPIYCKIYIYIYWLILERENQAWRQRLRKASRFHPINLILCLKRSLQIQSLHHNNPRISFYLQERLQMTQKVWYI